MKVGTMSSDTQQLNEYGSDLCSNEHHLSRSENKAAQVVFITAKISFAFI